MSGDGSSWRPGATAEQAVLPKVSGVRRRFSGSIRRLDAPTVLVVDDDPGIRMTFERILERGGFVPLVCDDPRVALRRCIAERPSVVVTDYSMPRMTGIELAEQIHRALGADAPPVIMVTGHNLDDLPAGHRASRVLVKPVAPGDLVEAVERSLPEPSAGEG